MEQNSVLHVIVKINWETNTDPFQDYCYDDMYSEKTSVLCACLDYDSAVKYVEQDGAACPYEMKWAGKNDDRWYYGYGPKMDGTGEHGTRYEIKETMLR